MRKPRKIDILSQAKVMGIGFAFLGLVLGVIYSFGGLIIDVLVSLGWIVSQETPGLSYGTVLAFGALIGMPLILGAVGFLAGVVGGILGIRTT